MFKLLLHSVLIFLFMIQTSILHAEYFVQSGDELRLNLAGEADFDEPFYVDRNGEIYLPEIGSLKVSGLPHSKLNATLQQSLKPVFKDISELKSMVSKRQIILTISGYVENPSDVILPANTTIQMALHAAGGLKPGAQLDRMQLHHNGKITLFNYKHYLNSGSTQLMPKLHSLDKIFIPASPMTGNVEVEFDPSKVADAGDAAEDRKAIKVFGEVNSPGSFSYRPSLNIIDILMRAGGVTRYAGVEQIRIINKGYPVIFNMKKYLDSGNISLLPTISEGSTLFVPIQEDEIKTGVNMVYIMGEVFKPGAYENKEDASFMDILANAGGPTRFAESRQIRIIHSDGTVNAFDLSGFTEGTGSGYLPKIKSGDAIFVPEKTDMNEKSWLKIAPNRAIRIIGEVGKPGRYEWSREMSLLDLLAHAGGPTSRADTANIDVLTPSSSSFQSQMILTHFNLDDFIQKRKSEHELPKLSAGSLIRIHDLPQDPSDNKAQWVRQSAKKSIYIFGQVGAPGRYMMTQEMSILDILAAADGPNENADIHNIRINHRNSKHVKVSKLDLGLYFETGDEHLLPKISAGDTLYIPEKNRPWLNQSKETTIRVLGAINKPGRYKFNDSMTLLDLLAEAGGTTSDAYIEKITVINTSCCKNQARTFNLLSFSQTADFTQLPVIRSGDTVFVPAQSQSSSSQFRVGLGDVFKMVSMAALLGLI